MDDSMNGANHTMEFLEVHYKNNNKKGSKVISLIMNKHSTEIEPGV